MSMDLLRARHAQSAADIEKRRRRVLDMEKRLEAERHQLAIEEARHDGLEEALKLTSEASADLVTPSGVVIQVKAKRGGRQVGAITEAWRKRLMHFYDLAASFDAKAMLVLMTEEGAKSSTAEIVRTLSKHLEHGYVELAPNGSYKVTEYAAQRFGFSTAKKTEAPASTGASAISVQGPAGSPGQLATHDVRDGSIPSGSTPVKNGSIATPAVHHATSPTGEPIM